MLVAQPCVGKSREGGQLALAPCGVTKVWKQGMLKYGIGDDGIPIFGGFYLFGGRAIGPHSTSQWDRYQEMDGTNSSGRFEFRFPLGFLATLKKEIGGSSGTVSPFTPHP